MIAGRSIFMPDRERAFVDFPELQPFARRRRLVGVLDVGTFFRLPEKLERGIVIARSAAGALVRLERNGVLEERELYRDSVVLA